MCSSWVSTYTRSKLVNGVWYRQIETRALHQLRRRGITRRLRSWRASLLKRISLIRILLDTQEPPISCSLVQVNYIPAARASIRRSICCPQVRVPGKTGTFYFAEKRNFLLCLDTT